MRWMAAAAISVLALLAGCQSKKPLVIRYVALGDSITAGLGASTPAHDCVSLFSAFLKAKVDQETVKNLGVPGLTTSELLEQLKSNPAIRDAVKEANVLTISIGANDLLPCINPFRGSINPGCAARGVKRFQKDWPLIIREIRSGIGSPAQIYVQNLYNIYSPSHPDFPAAENIVHGINGIIQSSAPGQYHVADVYSSFQGGEICLLTWVCGFIPDPHPTDAGYRRIAAAYIAAYP